MRALSRRGNALREIPENCCNFFRSLSDLIFVGGGSLIIVQDLERLIKRLVAVVFGLAVSAHASSIARGTRLAILSTTPP